MEVPVAVTRRAAAIEAIETVISHIVAADVGYRIIAERTDDPHIINEVRSGRGHLVAARTTLANYRNNPYGESVANETDQRTI